MMSDIEDHTDAFFLAQMKQEESNLARCYLDYDAEIERLRGDVIAYCCVWGTTWATEFGLPLGHLHPIHYDSLAAAGARMVDFTRADIPFTPPENIDTPAQINDNT